MLSLKKNNSFLPPFTPQFFIQKFISILHVKWTGMNKGGSRSKIRIFEWTYFLNDYQSLIVGTNIYDMLIFNLTHSLITL